MTYRFSVDGRIACVTGASSGLGRFLAGALAEAGAAVVGIARRKSELESWADGVRAAGGRAAIVQADLSDPTSLDEVAGKAGRHFGVKIQETIVEK